MLTAIKTFVAHLLVGHELERLARYDMATINARQWMAEFPEAAAALDHVRSVADGSESYAAVSSIRETMRLNRTERMNKLRDQAMVEARRRAEMSDRIRARPRASELAPVPMSVERRR